MQVSHMLWRYFMACNSSSGISEVPFFGIRTINIGDRQQGRFMASSIINCPVSKETLFKKKQSGVTEFLSKKSGVKDGEVMLIYNKKLSVSPLTTHIPKTK